MRPPEIRYTLLYFQRHTLCAFPSSINVLIFQAFFFPSLPLRICEELGGQTFNMLSQHCCMHSNQSKLAIALLGADHLRQMILFTNWCNKASCSLAISSSLTVASLNLLSKKSYLNNSKIYVGSTTYSVYS